MTSSGSCSLSSSRGAFITHGFQGVRSWFGWEFATVRDDVDAMHSPQDVPYVDLMTDYYEQ